VRILIVNAFYPPLTTGSAHFSHDVARQYRAQGHEVLVLTAAPEGAVSAETIDGVPVQRLPSRWVDPGRLSFNYSIPFVARLAAWGAVRRIVDEFRPDVIHQNGQFFDLTLLTSLVARRRRIPRVLTVHTPLTHTNLFARAFISSIDRTILRFFVRLGESRVFAVDRFTMEMCQRRYRPRHHDVEFIPATLEPNAFGKGDAERIRTLLGLHGKKVVLSFGHVIPIRSRKPLVRALPDLLRSIPEAVVVVVGHVYDTEFLRIADELHVADRLVIVGRVPHAEVPDYLAAADVECHDLDGHGIGITTFEVMAAGVPIVANVPRDLFPGISLDRWPLLRIGAYDTPSKLATELVEVLSADASTLDDEIAQQRDFVKSNFAADVVAARYLEIMGEMVSVAETTATVD
jgi:glycosyltransferase involved in cell wall biosynthesis